MKVTDSYTPGPQSNPELLATAYEWRSDAANLTNAIGFLAQYPWHRISEVNETCVVVEEIGRNTGAIFAWKFEGTPDEIRPLNQFLYLSAALGAVCFWSFAPAYGYWEKLIAETAKEIRRIPKDAHVPLPVVCSCFRNPEFQALNKAFTAQIPVAENPILVGHLMLSGSEWSPTNCYHASIAAMLASGISTSEDIVAGVKAADTYPDHKRVRDLLAAAEFSREGLCSFQEALEL